MNKLSINTSNKIYFKIAFILFLMFALLIPTGQIQGLIYERSGLHKQAINEMSQTWGAAQSITGPILIIPYSKENHFDNGSVTLTQHSLTILPNQVELDNQMEHEIRKRSIYEAILYSNTMDIKGNFKLPDLEHILKDATKVMWDKAVINFGVSNSQSISSVSDIKFNSQNSAFIPGILHSSKMGDGIHTPVAINLETEEYKFSFQIKFKGSSDISFQPIANHSRFEMKSTWPSPSFFGAGLPSSREISSDGFTATWETTQFNRTYPDHWHDDKYRLNEVKNEIGVKLINTVDHYQKNLRTVKYALLIISLTFFIFFFFEYLMGNQIHPIQYALVGLALSVFYLLLVSLSEHIQFNIAYWLGAGATISVILIYASAILKQSKAVVILGIALLILYSYIFVILQLEDFALLAGSLGLFAILATIMIMSRKVNWYALAENK